MLETDNDRNNMKINLTLRKGHLIIITLMKKFCAQPLRFVWLMYVQKAKLERDIVKAQSEPLAK